MTIHSCLRDTRLRAAAWTILAVWLVQFIACMVCAHQPEAGHNDGGGMHSHSKQQQNPTEQTLLDPIKHTSDDTFSSSSEDCDAFDDSATPSSRFSSEIVALVVAFVCLPLLYHSARRLPGFRLAALLAPPGIPLYRLIADSLRANAPPR